VRRLHVSRIFCVALVCLLAACSRAGAMPVVHMGDTNFTQDSITIQKGQTIQLVDDSAQFHTISNGSWVDGDQNAKIDAGAPVANELQINGNTQAALGPFNKVGTFHYFCSVHSGMNLTVVVTP